MNLEDAIYGRKSIRTFQQKEVEKEKIEEIISAGIYAPSASNRQGWKFVVIDDTKIKEKICTLNGGAMPVGHKLIMNAPSGILVLYRKDVSKNAILYRDHIQSASAAIQNMLLKAYSLGLGTCWICKLPQPNDLRRMLEIPKHYEIIAYIALGYPKEYISEHTLSHYRHNLEKANKRVRKYSVEQVMCKNKFHEHDSEDAIKYIKLLYVLQYIQLKFKNNGRYNFIKQKMNKLIVRLENTYKN